MRQHVNNDRDKTLSLWSKRTMSQTRAAPASAACRGWRRPGGRTGRWAVRFWSVLDVSRRFAIPSGHPRPQKSKAPGAQKRHSLAASTARPHSFLQAPRSTHSMDLLLLSPLFLAPEPLARPQPCGLSAPAVSETALGWEVRLATPGLSHKDVSVELVQKPNQLFLRLQGAEGAFKHVLRLPPKVEAAGVSATVTHGLLRVSLPKVQEIEVLPRDAKPADGSAAGGEHADEATVTLAVPGISHAEVRRCSAAPDFTPAALTLATEASRRTLCRHHTSICDVLTRAGRVGDAGEGLRC